MKSFLLKRISAAVVAVTLMLGSFSTVLAETQEPLQLTGNLLAEMANELVTKGQFAQMINSVMQLEGETQQTFTDVPQDHPFAAALSTAKAIGYMKGDGYGKVNPDKNISGAEASACINFFIGFDLSKVQADNGLSVPDWAKSSVSNLVDLSIIARDLGEKKELTFADANMFVYALGVAKLFSDGPYKLAQADGKDDFFAYTNRRFLATATIEPGYLFAMKFIEPEIVVKEQTAEILNGVLSAENPETDSDQWKIQQIYEMYLDNDGRTKSMEKIKPIFDEIKAAASISELNELAKKYYDYFNLQGFYGLSIIPDSKANASEWSVIVVPGGLTLGSRDYYADKEELKPIQDALADYFGKLLKYIGETDQIDERAKAMFTMDKARAQKSMPIEKLNSPDVLYTSVKWDEMLKATEKTNSLTYSPEILEIVKDFNIYCPDVEYIKYIESLYTEENLQVLKDFAMLNVLSTVSSFLGDDSMDLSDDLVKALYGASGGDLTIELRAQYFVSSMMSSTFSRIYAEKYATQKMKDDVLDIAETVRKKYAERINSLDWMSPETKKAAIEKLNAIKVFAAYPDEKVGSISYKVEAKKDGGNLIDIYYSIAEASKAGLMEQIQSPVERNLWEGLPTSTVNAFYSPQENAIIVPAGILQEPFYSADRKREMNLGGIGAVIAHEFSHAFDNNGAKYDKNGTLTNWWTENDYKAFSALTDKVAVELSKINFVGSQYVNGALCTGETIADLGGLACALDIADDMPGADMQMVMESWSNLWAARMSPETAAYLLSVDAHAPNKIRVNFILSQLADFYKAYDIQEGDGMYIKPENRVTIW